MNLLVTRMHLDNSNPYTALGFKEATSEYGAVIASRLRTSPFLSSMISLTDKYPYYIPPYLEILELSECFNNTQRYERFLSLALDRFRFLTESEMSAVVMANMCYVELLSLKKLLERFRGVLTKNPFLIYKILRVRDAVEEKLSQTPLPKQEKHLQCVNAHIDVNFINNELKKQERLWFVNTGRQTEIAYHRYTQYIELRVLKHREKTPIPIDGSHESVRTHISQCFPNTISFVENLALQWNCGLGKVSFIRLAPGKIAYRHADTERYLTGRTRYHLVVNAQKDNLLLSGNEIVTIENGQLWRYDNMTMHKSYNESNEWRTHLVFDIFFH